MKKKETSAVKYNTSGHYCGRRYNNNLTPHQTCMQISWRSVNLEMAENEIHCLEV